MVAEVTMRRDRSGRVQPTTHPSATQMARRRAKVKEYYQGGYQAQAIAKALGVSYTTVSDDITKMKLANRRKLGIGGRGLKSEAPPYDWREEPTPAPAYTRSAVVDRWEHALEQSIDRRSVNALANDAADALEARDLEWLAQRAELFAQVAEYAQRLQRVLRDPDYRHRALLNEEDVAL